MKRESTILEYTFILMKNINFIMLLFITSVIAYSLTGIVNENESLEFLSEINILVDAGFEPGIDKVIIGPCNGRPGTTKLGNNQSIPQEEAQTLEDMRNAGYDIEFTLLKEESIGGWDKFRRQYGFK